MLLQVSFDQFNDWRISYLVPNNSQNTRSHISFYFSMLLQLCFIEWHLYFYLFLTFGPFAGAPKVEQQVQEEGRHVLLISHFLRMTKEMT